MSVKRNIAANYAGSAWTALMGFAFVPVYLHYIGAEGYGLIGFFALLTSLLGMLDAGFGAAAGRQIARAGTQEPDAGVDARNLVRTLEWLFWCGAALVGGIIAFLAPQIAEHWLNLQQLGVKHASDAVRLMGVAFILQWPAIFYGGCLIALQRQVSLNWVNAVASSVRWGGAAFILWLISPSVQVFFAWQIASALLSVVLLRSLLWRAMPRAETPPIFEMRQLRKVRSFALGVAGINVLGLVLTQLDKVILSKILPLQEFGYYMLAWTLASLSYRLSGPVFNAVYPRLTQLVASGDRRDIAVFYRKSSQLMALVVVPFGLFLAIFGKEVVLLWTGDADLAARIGWVVACLALGSMLNGLMQIPYALQLAHGWTSLAVWTNTIAVSLLAPLTIYLATSHGLDGAALAWPILNLSYVALIGWITLTRLLPAELTSWYGYSVTYPVIVCFALLFLFGAFGGGATYSPLLVFCKLALIGLLCEIALGLLLPQMRTLFFEAIKAATLKPRTDR